MPENRCPMCSKPNPAEADVCQSCGARLKPLFVDSGNDDRQGRQAIPPMGSRKEEDSGRLAAGTDSQPLSAAEKDTPSDKSPDDVWMERFRSEAVLGGEDESADDETAAASDPSDDPWMDSFRSNLLDGELTLEQPEEELEEEAEDGILLDAEDDWLSRFRSGVVPPADEDTELHKAETSRLASHADKTAELKPAGQADPRSREEEIAAAADWSVLDVSISPQPPDRKKPMGIEDPGSLDWLDGLRPKDDETPDSLLDNDDSGLEWSSDEDVEQIEGIPDWLSGLGTDDDAGEPQAEPAADRAALPADDGTAQPGKTPDWLSGLRPEDVDVGGELSDSKESRPEQDDLQQTGVPDWLSGFGSEETEKDAADQETWLDIADLAAQSDAVQEPDLPDEAGSAQAGTPDWLSGLGSAQEVEETAGEPEGLGSLTWGEHESTPQPAGMPDRPGGSFDDSGPEDSAAPAAEEPWGGGDEDLELAAIPDWLSGFNSGEDPPQEIQPDDGDIWPGVLEGDAGSESYEDLYREAPAEGQQAGAETAAGEAWFSSSGETGDSASEEVPDWLSELREHDESAQEKSPSEGGLLDWPEASGELAPADVPDWFSGIRKDTPVREASEEALWDKALEGQSDEEVPEWLSRFSEEEAQVTHTAPRLPDGYGPLPGEQYVPDDAESACSFQEPDSDIGALDDFSAFEDLRGVDRKTETPDWLREAFDPDTETLLKDEESTRRQLDDLLEEDTDSGGLPEWYAGSRSRPSQPAAVKPPEAPPAGPPAGGPPAVEVEQSAAEQEPAAEQEVPPEDRAATPLWLQNIIDETRVDVDAELESVLAEVRQDEPDEVPDELSAASEEQTDDELWPADSLPDTLFDEEDEEELNRKLAEAELPSWLQDAKNGQSAETGRLVSEADEIGDDSHAAIDFAAIEEEDISPLELKEYEPGRPLFEDQQDELAEDTSWLDVTSFIEEDEESETDDLGPEAADEDLDSASMPEWLSQVHARQTKETTMLTLPVEDPALPADEIAESGDGETGSESAQVYGGVPGSSGEKSPRTSAPWLDDIALELPETLFGGGESDDDAEDLVEDLPDLPADQGEKETFDFSFEARSVPRWMEDLSGQSTGEDEPIEQIAFSLSDPDDLQPYSLKPEEEESEPALGWLDDLPEEEEPGLSEIPAAEGDIEEADMPDWLSQIRERQSGQTAFLVSPEAEVDGAEPGMEGAEGSSPGTSAWPPRRIDSQEKEDLEKISRMEADPSLAETGDSAPDEPFGTKPVWLEDLPDAPIHPPSAPAFIPGSLASDEIPAGDFPGEKLPAEDFNISKERQSSWLDEIKPAKQKPEPAEQPERINLARATLPAWLEAMRPVEGFIGAVEEPGREPESMETVGPLAGIAGALSAEPAVAAQHKMHSGPSILNISDGEYARADLLSRLLEDEGTELKAIPRHPSKRRQQIWIISALLLLAALLPSLIGFPAFSLPAQEPLDLVSVFSVVDSIPLEQPALVVYDVEPGYTAEMEAVAGPLLYHLLGRRVPVVTISSDMTGPVLIDRILRGITLPFIPQNGEDFLHLGYLSGGASGVQQFVNTPRAAGLQGYLYREAGIPEGGSVWDAPLLAGISSMGDFSMVAVVVNDADRARMWIEQAGPSMGAAPFLVVASTGLEPVVRPYYEGERAVVDGLLTGVPAAAAYDMRFQRSGDAAQLWNPYNAITTMAFLLLAGAMGWSLYRWIIDRKLKAENEAS